MMVSASAMIRIPTLRKATANTASTMMTMVMALTTEAVVPSPRLCVLGLTQAPVAADQGDEHAKHHRFAHGQPEVGDFHRRGSTCRK